MLGNQWKHVANWKGWCRASCHVITVGRCPRHCSIYHFGCRSEVKIWHWQCIVGDVPGHLQLWARRIQPSYLNLSLYTPGQSACMTLWRLAYESMGIRIIWRYKRLLWSPCSLAGALCFSIMARDTHPPPQVVRVKFVRRAFPTKVLNRCSRCMFGIASKYLLMQILFTAFKHLRDLGGKN